jgi:hypothetical protein
MLLAALFIAWEAIPLKNLSNQEQPIRTLVVNNSMGVLISRTVAVIFRVSPLMEHRLLLARTGASIALIQSCFIQAISRMDASVVKPF